MLTPNLGTHGLPTTKETEMGMDDKLKHSTEKTLGKAKEGLGNATDDRELQAEGKAEQSKSDLKQAGEKVKDAFKK
jgi:uncharacterized protein YjbJ (UPF0337 family)